MSTVLLSDDKTSRCTGDTFSLFTLDVGHQTKAFLEFPEGTVRREPTMLHGDEGHSGQRKLGGKQKQFKLQL